MTKHVRKGLPTWAKTGIVASLCAAVLAVGGALAYLTDTDSVTNRFTVADQLDIDLYEPAWDALPDTDGDGIPDEVESMVPTQTVAKDPRIRNTSGTEAWIIAQVSVPIAKVKAVLSDGSVEKAATQHELFSYQLNSGWTEQGAAVVSSDGEYLVHTYTADAKVAVGAETPAIFNAVKLINLADEQFSGAAQISINAFGVQTYGFNSATDAWTAYQKQHA